ncbi:hypothetical protein Hanom_Chr04g00366331 [Helianthus anomalus]
MLNRYNTYQIKSTSKASLDLNKLILATWRITSQGQHILNPVLLNRLQRMIYLLHRHISTR